MDLCRLASLAPSISSSVVGSFMSVPLFALLGYAPIEANGVPWIRQRGDGEFFVFFQVFGGGAGVVSADRKLTLAGKLTRDGSCAPGRSIDVSWGNSPASTHRR
jgi:hypothetical protein